MRADEPVDVDRLRGGADPARDAGHHRRRRAAGGPRGGLRPLAGLPAPAPAQDRRAVLQRPRAGQRRPGHRQDDRRPAPGQAPRGPAARPVTARTSCSPRSTRTWPPTCAAGCWNWPGRDILERVEVVNIDSLASRVVAEAEPGARRHWMDDTKAVERWEDMLLELGDDRLGRRVPARRVVAGHPRPGAQLPGGVLPRPPRGPGHGPSTARSAPRSGSWSSSSPSGSPKRTCGRSARSPRAPPGSSRSGAQAQGHRYRHVVVDEAQDLSPAHWMLLRAMVAPGPNDMFLAGDTHQRIYDNYVSLGSLGIAIRGPLDQADAQLPRPPTRSSPPPRRCSAAKSGTTSTAAPTPWPATGRCCAARARRSARLRQLGRRAGRDPQPGEGVAAGRRDAALGRGRRARAAPGDRGGELPERARHPRRLHRRGRAAQARRGPRRHPAPVQGA